MQINVLEDSLREDALPADEIEARLLLKIAHGLEADGSQADGWHQNEC